MLVVVFIIGMMASIVIVIVNQSREEARDTRRKADLAAIRTALELYHDRTGTYNVSYRKISGGVETLLATGANAGFTDIPADTIHTPFKIAGVEQRSVGYFNRKTCQIYPVGTNTHVYCYSVGQGLQSWGLLDPPPQDPQEQDGYEDYMFYTDGSKYSLYARLEHPKDVDGSGYDGSSSQGSNCSVFWGASCQSNYRLGNGK